jgi:hypothetical protein
MRENGIANFPAPRPKKNTDNTENTSSTGIEPKAAG